MKQYNPHKTPNAAKWLAMDEHRRIFLAQGYHRRANTRLPNEKAHAVAHVIVENQIALGDELPVRTLRRLIAEGLNRHEAIHAIGMVLVEFIYDLMKQPKAEPSEHGPDQSKPYYDALQALTAESWRRSGSEE